MNKYIPQVRGGSKASFLQRVRRSPDVGLHVPFPQPVVHRPLFAPEHLAGLGPGHAWLLHLLELIQAHIDPWATRETLVIGSFRQAFLGPLDDELTLELRHGREDVSYPPAGRGRVVEAVARLQLDALPLQRLHEVQEVS